MKAIDSTNVEITTSHQTLYLRDNNQPSDFVSEWEFCSIDTTNVELTTSPQTLHLLSGNSAICGEY